MNVTTKLDALEKYAREVARRTDHYENTRLKVRRDPGHLSVSAINAKTGENLYSLLTVDVRSAAGGVGCALVVYLSCSINGRLADVEQTASGLGMLHRLARSLNDRIKDQVFEP